MPSCLETRSTAERTVELARSTYNISNEYNASHPDALADGDWMGRGTGSSGHSHWLPDCTSALNIFNYSNFDTDARMNIGTSVDNNERNTELSRCLYNPSTPYGNVTITMNPGQYVVP